MDGCTPLPTPPKGLDPRIEPEIHIHVQQKRMIFDNLSWFVCFGLNLLFVICNLCMRVCVGFAGAVESLSWHSSTDYLAVGCWDNTVSQCDEYVCYLLFLSTQTNTHNKYTSNHTHKITHTHTHTHICNHTHTHTHTHKHISHALWIL